MHRFLGLPLALPVQAPAVFLGEGEGISVFHGKWKLLRGGDLLVPCSSVQYLGRVSLTTAPGYTLSQKFD